MFKNIPLTNVVIRPTSVKVTGSITDYVFPEIKIGDPSVKPEITGNIKDTELYKKSLYLM